MNGIETVRGSYIKDLIMSGKRMDSRGNFDMREISVENGPIYNAEGSSRVRLGLTDVMAGVKTILGEPYSDTPDEGTLTVSAELLPLAASEFETGPPSPEAIELARVVDRGIRAGECVDLKSLFMEEGKAIALYVDVYVLDYDGNLFDACSLAAMNALMNTKLPKYENGELILTERNTDLKINNIVTSATFGRFGDAYILDMTREEEAAAEARITITTDGKIVRAMQKGLNGSFAIKHIDQLIGVSLEKHDYLRRYVKKG